MRHLIGLRIGSYSVIGKRKSKPRDMEDDIWILENSKGNRHFMSSSELLTTAGAKYRPHLVGDAPPPEPEESNITHISDLARPMTEADCRKRLGIKDWPEAKTRRCNNCDKSFLSKVGERNCGCNKVLSVLLVPPADAP